MSSPEPTIDLEQVRLSIVGKMHALRLARGWTQAELAAKLGLSQARLSVIERGGGTISAEQLVALLSLGNLSLAELLPPANADAALQNALARLGARGLREHPDTLPSERVATARDAIREVLVVPDSPRLVVALAPVLVWNIDSLNLHAIHHELARLGLAHRLGWLAENVLAALEGRPRPPKPWALRVRAARVELGSYIEFARAARVEALARHPAAPDRFDTDIASARTAAEVALRASDVSKAWGVVSRLQPSEFGEALDAAYASR